MSFSVEGKLERGMNCAHDSFALQLPFVSREFPEVAGCHHGTLNLRLAAPLLVLVPDHRTQPIPWRLGVSEVIDLLRIRLEAPADAAPVPAWIYVAHGSGHRQDLWLHEVVTREVAVSEGTMCRVHVDRPAIQLPYAALPVVVVF